MAPSMWTFGWMTQPTALPMNSRKKSVFFTWYPIGRSLSSRTAPGMGGSRIFPSMCFKRGKPRPPTRSECHCPPTPEPSVWGRKRMRSWCGKWARNFRPPARRWSTASKKNGWFRNTGKPPHVRAHSGVRGLVSWMEDIPPLQLLP